MLVYGAAGVGKTSLIRTLPDPVVLSAEGGLLSIDDQWITVKPAGRMLVRAIAMVFDRYLRADRERTRYSKVI